MDFISVLNYIFRKFTEIKKQFFLSLEGKTVSIEIFQSNYDIPIVFANQDEKAFAKGSLGHWLQKRGFRNAKFV